MAGPLVTRVVKGLAAKAIRDARRGSTNETAAPASARIRKPRHQHDSMPAYSKPKLLRKEPKLTAKELLASVWPGDKERSKDIAVRRIKRVRSPKALPNYITFRAITMNKENRHIHYVTILFKDRVGPKSKVIVDSDTPRHTFFYEYALARRGNAFIWRSNGDPAVRTNPRNKAGIDKHTFVALRHILRSPDNRGE